MINSVSAFRNDAIGLLKEKRAEIQKKVTSGEVEPAIAIGGNAFTDTAWDKLIDRVDATIEDVKEEQQIRFARMDEEREEKELLIELDERKQRQEDFNAKELLMNQCGISANVPYSYLAKDGVIEYNGVTFFCDEVHNAICLGDMTNPEDVINIPLTEGGCLKVNRENIFELSKAITMFSASDIRRIMEAIAKDAKCQQMKLELDEDANSIGDSAEAAMENGGADVVTAEQIALLFKDREEIV